MIFAPDHAGPRELHPGGRFFCYAWIYLRAVYGHITALFALLRRFYMKMIYYKGIS